MSITYYTEEEMREARNEAEAFRRISHDFSRIFARIVEPNAPQRRSDGTYCYIPHDYPSVLRCLNYAYKHLTKDGQYRSVKFIEAGSGLPLVSVLARSIGFSGITAVELSRDIVEHPITKILLDEEISVKMVNDNILNIDYSGFDVVYYYRPFADEESEKKFEMLVEGSIKVGSIVIGAYKTFYNYENRNDFKLLYENYDIKVIQKIKNVKKTKNKLS